MTFSDTETESIHSTLQSLMPRYQVLEDIEYLPGGYSNRNYRIKVDGSEFVLRICLKVKKDTEVELQYLGLPCSPNVIAYDQSTGNMVTKFIDGEHLVVRPFSISECVVYLQDLHRQIPRRIRTHNPIEISLGHFEKSGIRNELGSYLAKSKWTQRTVCGCHNDLNPYNILRRDEGICTLDWEFAGDNEPLFDLVNLCAGLNYSDDDTAACAHLYLRSTYDPQFLLETRIVFEIREHAWALAQIATGNDRIEIRDQASRTEAEFHRLIGLKKYA